MDTFKLSRYKDLITGCVFMKKYDNDFKSIGTHDIK